jgi:hypothetical protein
MGREVGKKFDRLEDDLRSLNVEESKINKIKKRFVSVFEIMYWNAMIKVLEEWT